MRFYKKKGTPEVDEIVMCTVKKILYHSVFVSIDDYKNIEGMVHISEIAPGRIRNLRDYVKEGKRIVCKVLRVSKETGNIDLSLRRVGKIMMVKRLTHEKQEEKAEKLLEGVGKELKLNLKKMYDEVGYKAVEKYGGVHNFFQKIITDGKKVIDDLGVEKRISDKLYKAVVEKIKPTELEVGGVLSLRSYGEKGIEDIKKVLVEVEKKGVAVSYLGAPKYKLVIKGSDYKVIEGKLRGAVDESIKKINAVGGEGSFAKGG